MQFTLTDAQVKAIIDGLKTVLENGGDSAWMLFTDDLTPDKNTALADLTAPTFTGYARQAFTAGAVYRDESGNWAITLGDAQFTATATPGSPQIVYGWAIVDDLTTPTEIFAAGRLDNPRIFATNGDGLVLSGRLGAQQDSGTTLTVTETAEQGT